jgi:hypothetical protein
MVFRQQRQPSDVPFRADRRARRRYARARLAAAGVQIVGVLGFLGFLLASRFAPDLEPLLQILAFLWFFAVGALWLVLPSLARRRRRMG